MSSSSPNMQIITLSGGKVRVIEDLTDGELERVTDDSRGGHLLLDFSNVEYVNSDDLAVLSRWSKVLSQDPVENPGKQALFCEGITAHLLNQPP